MRFVTQVLKESLRLWPTAPAFTRHAYEPTVLGGKYQIDKQTSLTVLTPMLHRDQKIWGENAETFYPERFAPEAERSIPPTPTNRLALASVLASGASSPCWRPRSCWG